MKEDSEMRRDALALILSKADNLWESMGPDGITYDFNTNILRMDEEERKEVYASMNNVDAEVAKIRAAAIVNKNYFVLGVLVINQVDDYFEDEIEELMKEQQEAEA